MKGYATALGLSLLLGISGAATAATAVLDLADVSKTSNATLVANADGKTTEVTEGGVKAVKTSGTEGTTGYFYLDVKDDLFKDSKAVWVRVDYFDQGTDTFQVEYDTEAEPNQPVPTNPRLKFDTRVWTSHTVKLIDFSLQGRQEGKSDIRISDEGDGPEIISKVTVTDEDPDKIRFPKVDPAKPITIDGKKGEGEWDDAYSVTMDRAEFDVIGGANWGGKEDFSGTYSFKWDEKGMYVLGEVVDATPRLNDAEGASAWNGDGIELFIGLDQSDPNRTTYQEGTDFHVFIGLGEEPRWGNQYAGVSSEEQGPIPAQNLAIVNTDSPKGYMFELFLPWTFLKEDAKVTEGQEIAWYMFANNSKEIGPSAQQVAMAPFKRNGPSGNPSRWATAVLQPAQTVENPPAAGP